MAHRTTEAFAVRDMHAVADIDVTLKGGAVQIIQDGDLICLPAADLVELIHGLIQIDEHVNATSLCDGCDAKAHMGETH